MTRKDIEQLLVCRLQREDNEEVVFEEVCE